ncbi:MexH family multidrug efflux RND transporter periplasmic adaptor subunit [Hypericibacter adhaerens]|jgi:membrane fusion protein (multidrug efflux system)|uniref:MexH family multidrug efflux RND transporter periplasmic adaptor subunit n=1 Tax=Hypericibacter adhaerens TaxID=2602016 RepID=A0A5J6N5S2_9PROT|nr:efflux RND transporter periplasmic adaptor subunit [Hypericibacter adhaerens]QEX25259.1 MexH family multidrug efflux RND transporter periplasmic adaptor subunit [Hypericibacter adhaerens]
MRRIVLIVILLIAAAAAGGYWWKTRQAAQEAASASSEAPAGGFSIPVEASPVETASIDLVIPAVGTLRSNESIRVAPEIPGRLAEILVQEGQKIDEGTVIARLDQSVYRAELEQAQSGLDLAKADVERYKKMRAGEVASEQSMQRAVAALNENLARIALAQANLAKTELRAPFDGVLGLRRVSLGDYLDAGDVIINLEQVDPLKVDFRVPEIYYTTVNLGQTIKLAIDALPGETFEGTIYAMDPLIDAGGRAIVLRAHVPNSLDKLRPGLFARVSLVYDTHPNALLVPESAIVPFGSQKFVFRVVDGKAVQTAVKVGEYINDKVEVLEGLKAGELVVTAGQLKIADGMGVTPIPNGTAPSGSGQEAPGQGASGESGTTENQPAAGGSGSDAGAGGG